MKRKRRCIACLSHPAGGKCLFHSGNGVIESRSQDNPNKRQFHSDRAEQQRMRYRIAGRRTHISGKRMEILREFTQET